MKETTDFNLKQILNLMARRKASDLYLTTGTPPVFKIQGKFVHLGTPPLTPDQTLTMAEEIIEPAQMEQFKKELELDMAYSLEGKDRFRVNLFQQRGQVGMVVRRIEMNVPTIDDLNLPQVLKHLAILKRGLILVCGATGSGKSTTLAAIIDFRNASMGGHIITIEDPIEFVHQPKKSLITQREVGIDTHSFHSALRSALRQAPDLLLIGEIRDRISMESALQFCETGHLVLGTLHANNSNQALERILNFFPVEEHHQVLYQLSLNLKGVVSQRLIPTVAGQRAAAIEIMMDTPRASDLIAKGDIEELKTYMSKSQQDGMQTFDQALYQLFTSGKISEETALANADSANDLRLKIKVEFRGGDKSNSKLSF